MDSDITLGVWLKRRRRQVDLTQKGLAHRVGCSVGTIRKIEADERRPSRQLAGLIAQHLEIPTEQHEEFVAFARAEPYISGVSFQSLTAEAGQIPSVPAVTQGPALQVETRMLRGYELQERIAAGQFGVVYRAIQQAVRREVAIKVIQPQYANEPEFIRRFEAEAQIVARLEHPHIVPLYDYWREADGAYLVMRWLRGGSLKDALADGLWTLEASARLIQQIAAGLTFAHLQGVVHRDIKPANILLDEEGTAYLSDFGIAKDLAGVGGLTQTGAMVGSPHYSAPEQVLDEPITPQTDLYSLGVVIYELLNGRHPFPESSPAKIIFQHVNEPLPEVRVQRPEVPAAVDEVIQKATAKNPADRFADAISLAAALEAAILGRAVQFIDEGISTVELVPLEVEITNPYRGLRPFQEADAPVFFGRQTLIDRLLAHLQKNQFLAVVGPSGSGKSSVVKAGLIPALRRGAIAGSEQWFIAQMLPGGHPLEELEAALLRVAVNPPTSLLNQLNQDDRGLLRAIKRILPGGEDSQLLLVIDQFEELFTLLAREEARAHFLHSLQTAVTESRSPLRIVITLRADFYDQPLLRPAFGQLMRQNTEVVLPLLKEELREAIEAPARRVGVVLAEGLTEEIIAEVSEQPGGLPLLQYAVTELFERRRGSVLTRAAYAEIGGVLGALGRRAEDLYAGLDEAKQAAARQLFLRLVTLGEGVEDTRRRVQITELASMELGETSDEAAVLHEVMDNFGEYRLLTFDHDPITRGPTVEVAHEALLREWPRLLEWLAESRADVRQQRLLAQAAAEWVEAEEADGYLLRGARLDQFEGWAEETKVALTRQEQDYLAACVTERQARVTAEKARQQKELEQAQKLAQVESERAQMQTRNAQRLRRFALGLAGLLLLAVVATIFAIIQMGEANEAQVIANQEAANAISAQATAEASALEAERQQRITLAQSLAAQASVVLEQNNDAELAVLLAIEAAHLNWQAEGNRQWLIDNTLRPLLSAENYHFNNTLRGHGDEVWSVAFSPDGQWLASAGGGTSRVHDNAIRLWDLDDPAAEPTLLTGHESRVSSVAFSPGGQWLASGSSDNMVRLWALGDPTVGPILLDGHERDVNAVTFSPDGQWLASGSSDRTIRLWKVADPGAEPVLLTGHLDNVNSVAFSPNGQWLASGGEDRTIRLWDLASDITNLPILSIPLTGDFDKVYSVVFSPDGQWLATGSFDGTIQLWDVALVITDPEADPIRLEGHESTVRSVAFSPDGRWLASSSFQDLNLWDLTLTLANPAIEPALLRGHQDFVNSVTFSPDGETLASGGTDTTIRLWNVGTPVAKPIPLESRPRGVHSVAFSPDGRWLAGGTLGNNLDNSIIFWDMDNPAIGPSELIGHKNPVWSVAYSFDSQWLASGGPDAVIRLWSMDNTAAKPRLLDDNQEGVNSLVFSIDGQWLASGSNDGTVRLWELARVLHEPTAEPVRLAGHQGVVESVDFGPDGRWLASGGEDRIVRLWDMSDLSSEPIKLEGHKNTVASLAFSPDGQWLVSAEGSQWKEWFIDTDATIYLWSISDPSAEPILLRGYKESNTEIAFSPDGRWLAVGSGDETLRVWAMVDLTKEPVLHPTGDNIITSIAFHPEGQWIAVGVSNRSTFLWPTLNGLVDLGCQAVRRNLTLVEWNRHLPGELYRQTCPNLTAHTNPQ